MFYFTFFDMINTNIFYFVQPKGILIKGVENMYGRLYFGLS